jgi:hypothetical protein
MELNYNSDIADFDGQENYDNLDLMGKLIFLMANYLNCFQIYTIR